MEVQQRKAYAEMILHSRSWTNLVFNAATSAAAENTDFVTS